VSLADVTGHGVGPALVTAVCRAYMRAGFISGRAFSELISHLNDLLVADLPDNRFVTCVAALLDPQAESLEMISAGHGPMFHYRAADHSLVEFAATDLPLGVASPISYSPAIKIDLQAGDLFLMLTDGFFEWRRADDEEFGLDRLREAVIAAGELPIDEVIPRLYGIVEAFADGRPQDDDVTAVVIRRSR
jgi:serine phosphatase RsbU (regulator of sigma subunit)